MRNIIFYSFCLVMLFGCDANKPVIVPANNPLIEYSGRIDFSNPLAPCFSYSGVTIRFAVQADSAEVLLSDDKGENYMAVIVDQVYKGKFQTKKGENYYCMAKDLSSGVHEIELVKATEEMFGKICFKEIRIPGQLVEIKNKRNHTIEFIGNSITCGYGNEGKLGETFGASTENHYMTYAAITARSFDAKPITVCKSGIGIYRNYDGPINGNVDCMPNYYDRVFLYDSMPKYSFSAIPDLICINLGTNDFSTSGPDTLLFVNSYLKFIDQIQSKYPNPEIICLLGPMLEDKGLIKARNCIQFVVDQANKNNKGKVHFFEMSAQNGDLGIGIDYHPTVEQHIANACELIKYIKDLKGWEIKPLIIKAHLIGNNQVAAYTNYPLDFEKDQLLISVDGSEVFGTSVVADADSMIYTITSDDLFPANQVIEVELSNNENNFINQCKVE